MDQASRKEFDRITQLTPEELTPAEINFLFARRSYLGKTKREEFADVLKAKEDQLKAAAQEDQPKEVKKGK